MDRLARRLAGSPAAEDVLHESLAAAWRSRRRFHPERGSAQAWLLTIVANKARDHLGRNDAGRQGLGLSNAAALTAPTADVVESLDVGAAVSRLSERQRLAVALFYYVGLTVEQCADVMNCNVGTVKSTLADGRRRLRELLGGDYR